MDPKKLAVGLVSALVGSFAGVALSRDGNEEEGAAAGAMGGLLLFGAALEGYEQREARHRAELERLRVEALGHPPGSPGGPPLDVGPVK